MEYDGLCPHNHLDTVKRYLGRPSWYEVSIFGSIYRGAEAADSLENLVRADNKSLTDKEVATLVVCGTSQLGGLFYSLLSVTALIIALVFCLPGLAVGGCCFRQTTKILGWCCQPYVLKSPIEATRAYARNAARQRAELRRRSEAKRSQWAAVSLDEKI